MLIHCPRFKVPFHAETIAPDQVFIFDEKGLRHLLKGKAYYLIAPYLSASTYTVDEIADKLQKEIPAVQVYYALLRLQKCDLLEEAKDHSSLNAFSQLLGCPQGTQNLRKSAISVIALGNVSRKYFIRKLCSFSLQIVPEEKSNLSIVLTDQYRRKEIAELSAKWEKEKKPYFLIKPKGFSPWIGPLFIPGKTRCYHCLLDYLQRNEQDLFYVEKKKKLCAPLLLHQAELPSSQTLSFELAINEILKWVLSGNNAEMEGKILSYNPLCSSLTVHHVLYHPRCLVCGSNAPIKFAPISLKSWPKKRLNTDGGYRITPPEETFQKYQHLISPITGVVNHLQRLSLPFFPSLPLFGASSLMISSETPLQTTSRSQTAGKGKSEIQAKASCLCEALERYSGVFQGNEIRKRAKYGQLGDAMIHPHQLLLFSEKQYRERKEQKPSGFDWIPHPFDETLPINWTPAWSLTEKRRKWLPTGFCYYSYPDEKTKKVFFIGDSNGCAAGNNLEEAILQGFFELVERDSVALWWYPRLRRAGVDLSSFPDPYIMHTVETYRQKGREIWAIDLTTDLKIPCFSVFSDKKGPPEEILFGFGAHFDPQIALLRALTEMGQSLFLTTLPNEDLTKIGRNEAFISWLRQARLPDHPYLLPNPRLKAKRYTDYTRFDTDDLKEDILQCKKIVEAKGMEMIVLNQTRAEIGLFVVKVVVPGLRHFWPRFAKGRLYDIPFELGLVEKKLSEKELNPLGMFW